MTVSQNQTNVTEWLYVLLHIIFIRISESKALTIKLNLNKQTCMIYFFDVMSLKRMSIVKHQGIFACRTTCIMCM